MAVAADRSCGSMDEVENFENCELSQELEVLQEIYIKELSIKRNARGQVLSIDVDLHPSTGENVDEKWVCLTLQVIPPPDYPYSVPDIIIRSPRGLGDEHVNSLKKALQKLAEDRVGNSMIHELIEYAKESLTEGNTPHGRCMICLEEFSSSRKEFTKTDCYHYFHCSCLCAYIIHCKTESTQNDTHVSVVPIQHQQQRELQIVCPVCRDPLSDHPDLSLSVGVKWLTDDSLAERYVPSTEVRELQRQMAELYEKQKMKGGIIDLEAEQRKYLLPKDFVYMPGTKAVGSDAEDGVEPLPSVEPVQSSGGKEEEKPSSSSGRRNHPIRGRVGEEGGGRGGGGRGYRGGEGGWQRDDGKRGYNRGGEHRMWRENTRKKYTDVGRGREDRWRVEERGEGQREEWVEGHRGKQRVKGQRGKEKGEEEREERNIERQREVENAEGQREEKGERNREERPEGCREKESGEKKRGDERQDGQRGEEMVKGQKGNVGSGIKEERATDCNEDHRQQQEIGNESRIGGKNKERTVLAEPAEAEITAQHPVGRDLSSRYEQGNNTNVKYKPAEKREMLERKHRTDSGETCKETDLEKDYDKMSRTGERPLENEEPVEGTSQRDDRLKDTGPTGYHGNEDRSKRKRGYHRQNREHETEEGATRMGKNRKSWQTGVGGGPRQHQGYRQNETKKSSVEQGTAAESDRTKSTTTQAGTEDSRNNGREHDVINKVPSEGPNLSLGRADVNSCTGSQDAEKEFTGCLGNLVQAGGHRHPVQTDGNRHPVQTDGHCRNRRNYTQPRKEPSEFHRQVSDSSSGQLREKEMREDERNSIERRIQDATAPEESLSRNHKKWWRYEDCPATGVRDNGRNRPRKYNQAAHEKNISTSSDTSRADVGENTGPECRLKSDKPNQSQEGQHTTGYTRNYRKNWKKPNSDDASVKTSRKYTEHDKIEDSGKRAVGHNLTEDKRTRKSPTGDGEIHSKNSSLNESHPGFSVRSLAKTTLDKRDKRPTELG